mgnify:CR=1 FL=1
MVSICTLRALPRTGSLEGLTDDVNEVRRNCGYLTGTAFFIDDKGTLLTNRHVASPTIDEAQVKQCLMNMIEYVKALYEARMSELTSQYNALEAQKSDCVTTDYWGYAQVDQMRVSQIESQQNALQQQFSELAQERSNLDTQLDVSSISIHPICQLGIAYNDSYVTTEADFLQNNPCNTLRIAQDKDTDLALIQLRSGLTPKKCHIFAVDGSNTNGGFWNRLFGTESLSQLQGICGTVFHTLPAGHTLLRVHLRCKIGADGIRCAEQRCDTHGKTGTAAAVADCRRFTQPVCCGHLMHKTVVLRKFQDFQHFLPAHLTASSCPDIIFCSGSHLDTDILFQMSAALRQAPFWTDGRNSQTH